MALQQVLRSGTCKLRLKGHTLLSQLNQSEVCQCAICGSTDRAESFSGPDRLRGLPGCFTVVRCGNCGLYYQSPRLPWSELVRYYEGGYVAFADAKRSPSSGLRAWFGHAGLRRRRGYVERFVQDGSLLDVGCGTGAFLLEMKASGRWDVSGLEPTAEAAEQARNSLGAIVTISTMEQAELEEGSQDVITMWNVLEHTESPMLALRKAHEALRPGGHLILAIPNYESVARVLFGRFWTEWDLPRHLFVFPRATLLRMFAEAGFGVAGRRCFLLTYHSLGNSLSFWLQSWPVFFGPIAHVILRSYYSAPMRIAIYPLQWLTETLGLSSVATWALRKEGRISSG